MNGEAGISADQRVVPDKYQFRTEVIKPRQLHDLDVSPDVNSHHPEDSVFEWGPFHKEGHSDEHHEHAPSPERKIDDPPVHGVGLLRSAQTGNGVVSPSRSQVGLEATCAFRR